MSGARIAGELQGFQAAVTDELANMHNLAMLSKWRCQAYESMFLKPRGAVAWAVILSIFAPGVLRRAVEAEFGRIVRAHHAAAVELAGKMEAQAEASREERVRAQILKPGGFPQGVMATIGGMRRG